MRPEDLRVAPFTGRPSQPSATPRAAGTAGDPYRATHILLPAHGVAGMSVEGRTVREDSGDGIGLSRCL